MHFNKAFPGPYSSPYNTATTGLKSVSLLGFKFYVTHFIIDSYELRIMKYHCYLLLPNSNVRNQQIQRFGFNAIYAASLGNYPTHLLISQRRMVKHSTIMDKYSAYHRRMNFLSEPLNIKSGILNFSCQSVNIQIKK